MLKLAVRLLACRCGTQARKVWEGSRVRVSEFISQDDLEAVRELLELVTSNGLGEISVTLTSGAAITITTQSAAAPAALPVIYSLPPSGDLNLPQVGAPIAAVAAEPVRAGSPAAAANRSALPSPMVGIYYGSPSPGDPPFVVPGDRIQIGQTIGLIEAMKVFSEIPSDVAGRVVEVAVSNGELVQLGQALLYVESD